MTDYDITNIFLLAAGVLVPIAFAFHVFLGRSLIYETWAKRGVIIICLGALGWGSLDWILLNSTRFHLTREVYEKLHGFRGLLGGVCIGIALSISLAHAYRKKVHKPEQVGSSAG